MVKKFVHSCFVPANQILTQHVLSNDDYRVAMLSELYRNHHAQFQIARTIIPKSTNKATRSKHPFGRTNIKINLIKI